MSDRLEQLEIKLATREVRVGTHLRATEHGVTRVKSYTRTQPIVTASLMFQEVEHEGDLANYWEGGQDIWDWQGNIAKESVGKTPSLSKIAQKHGVRLLGFQALPDVDEDSNETEGGGYPHDEFYDGGGRYEVGVIDVQGPQDKMRAFLKEARKASGDFHVAKASWAGTPPRKPPMRLAPTPGFDKWKSLNQQGIDERLDIMAGKTKLGELIHFPRTSSYPGSSYAPKPARWQIANSRWGGFVGPFDTKEAALKGFRKAYNPPPKL